MSYDPEEYVKRARDLMAHGVIPAHPDTTPYPSAPFHHRLELKPTADKKTVSPEITMWLGPGDPLY